MREITISRPLDAESAFERTILDHPSLEACTLATNIARGKQAALVTVRGSAEALAALRSGYLARPPRYVVGLKVVRAGRREIVFFVSIRTKLHPLDIAGTVERVLGPETLVAFYYDRGGLTWRIATLREDRIPKFLASIGDRYDAIERALARSIPRFHLVAFHEAAGPGGSLEGLEPAERRVWELASRMGYYERPRKCTLKELARRADMPTSTLHYRLREAERKVHLAYARLAG